MLYVQNTDRFMGLLYDSTISGWRIVRGNIHGITEITRHCYATEKAARIGYMFVRPFEWKPV